jgi:hypothetical protein
MLRENLDYMINEKKGNLLDEEVITASKMLDVLITEYNRILEEKMKR